MPGPVNPVVAAFPIPPPVMMLPWGTLREGGKVYLDGPSFEFLQTLWAAIMGQGGAVDLITQASTPVSQMTAVAESLMSQDGRAPAMDGRILGMLAAVLQAAKPFGVTFTCGDVSTKPLGAVVARAPAGVPWNMPVGLFRSCGKVTGAPVADTAFDLQVDGASVGTATWAAGQTTPTFTKAAATLVQATDWLDLVTPPNLNGMAGAFGLTVMGAMQC